MTPCRGEYIRLGISRIRGYFDIGYLATKVAPTESPARHANYEPCRGEFIRLSIKGIRENFDISHLATKVAPTKCSTSPAHHEKLNHKNKKLNVSSVFILALRFK
jgi:hypothetical protein